MGRGSSTALGPLQTGAASLSQVELSWLLHSLVLPQEGSRTLETGSGTGRTGSEMDDAWGLAWRGGARWVGLLVSILRCVLGAGRKKPPLGLSPEAGASPTLG